MSQTLQSKIAKIADLLSQAGSAHHHYEQTELKGVYDQNWAAWYADYVIEHGLNKLLPQSVTVAQLSQFLTESNRGYEQTGKRQTWADFTAADLIQQFG